MSADGPVEVVIRCPRVLAKLAARLETGAAPSAVAARDLDRYYALLDRERPGALVGPFEAPLIREALSAYREAARAPGPRPDGEPMLATAVEAHAATHDVTTYRVDIPALVERLRALRPLQLLAAVDLIERVDPDALRGNPSAREEVRLRFGILT